MPRKVPIPASASSLLVIVNVQVACWMRECVKLVRPVRLGRLRRRAAALLADVVVLLLPVDGQLVALRRLPRQTRRFRCGRRVSVKAGCDRSKSTDHDVRLVGVLVDPHARDRVVRDDLAHGQVEPELVPDDPATTHGVHVVQVVQLVPASAGPGP